MKRRYNQKELVELLETNPSEISVFYNESKPDKKDAYIFLDGLLDDTITRDGGAIYVNKIQIQIYAKDVDVRNCLMSFVRQYFIIKFVKYKENSFNVATGTVDLIIEDWNG